jgi:hypothetical protein
MAQKEPFFTVEFDQNGDFISVQFAGEQKIYEATHRPLQDPPHAPFIGSRILCELWAYQIDDTVKYCVKFPPCFCVGQQALMDKMGGMHS